MTRVLMMGTCFLVVGAVWSAVWAETIELYRKPAGVQTRWVSFENPTGTRGAGGTANKGAKGAAFDYIKPRESKVLLDVQGSGMIRRTWLTIRNREAETLRSLRLEMYWDGAATPAVSGPLGDFFCAILGRPVAFESALFSNPEGRSFNCYIPMPFRKSAKVVLINDSDKHLGDVFYDIDYLLGMDHPDDVLYFHASWRRERWTTLGKDFEILPKVRGAGRFLGANIGVIVHPDNIGWWGEGEVKMYIDGDTDYPTIIGTGTEDYIGTGWGQGTYAQRYQGSLVSDGKNGHFTFYRYHVPDPVYFDEEIRVTMQQIGGSNKAAVLDQLKKGRPIKPVSIIYGNTFVRLLDADPPIDLEKHESPESAWVNFYRQDDWSAVAFLYLDAPENGLPTIAELDARIEGLELRKKK